MNNLKVWQTDIGNAYLEAYTNEKVYVIAGPEFGELEGHIFVIRKALYGLKTSSVRWHERFSGVLRDMGFLPSFAEPDIWMRDMGDHYEYIATYVDDLTIASRNPQAIIDVLENKPNNFKLKCQFGTHSMYLYVVHTLPFRLFMYLDSTKSREKITSFPLKPLIY